MNNIDLIKKYVNEYGLNVLPTVRNEKRPAGTTWSEYQSRIITPQEIEDKFTDVDLKTTRVGIVCGIISGSLEVIDIDNHLSNAEKIYNEYRSLPEVNDIISKCIVEKTQGGGFHIYYRCSAVEGNLKLASWPTENAKTGKAAQECIIETRGEGGYIVCAPSEGYVLIQGDFSSIPEISIDERDTLLSATRTFNKVETYAKSTFKEGRTFTGKPWELYNESEQGLSECKDLLTEHGWKLLYTRNNLEYWVRPGKNIGTSATFDDIKFRVYSTNGSPFETQYIYVPSVIYTLLKYGDTSENFKQATRDFVKMGFGTPIENNSATDIQKVEVYLSSLYDFRINDVTSNLEMKKKADEVFHDAGDYDLSSIYREIQHKGFSFSYDRLNNLLNSDYVTKYDPFIEYFDALPVWDGHDYIEELCDTVELLDVNKKAFWYKSLRRFLIAMTACATQPGLTNEVSINFFGSQGLGKTKWFNKLVPNKLDPAKYLYVGSVNDDKDSKINLSTRLLINLDELGSLNREEIGYLKSLFSLDKISLREPYMRKSKNYIRRASFVGSIDREEFLTDLSGTRRFLAFSVKNVDYQHTVDMDKVFSQAYTLFKQGEQFYFDPNEISEIENNNEDFRLKTYEEGLLVEHFAIPLSPATATPMTTTEIAQVFNDISQSYKVTDASLKKLGQILGKLGFEKKNVKRSGMSKKCWLVQKRNIWTITHTLVTESEPEVQLI
jgi:hypothetical protein